MRKQIVSIFILILLLVNVSFSQDFDWLKKMKQIHLLSDTYEDVLKVFGNPIDGTSQRELSEYFDIKEGRVFAHFASGECVVAPDSNGRLTGWKVPAYTVIELSFSPNERMKLKKFAKELKLNLKSFRSYEIYDVPGAFIYENDKIGMSFSVDRKGKVESINFYPPEKLDYLYCR